MAKVTDVIEGMKIKPPQKPAPAGPNASSPAAPPKVAVPDPPPAPRRYWRVVKGGEVSLFGQITDIPTGDLLDMSSYSPLAIERMRTAGLVLEEHVEGAELAKPVT